MGSLKNGQAGVKILELMRTPLLTVSMVMVRKINLIFLGVARPMHHYLYLYMEATGKEVINQFTVL